MSILKVLLGERDGVEYDTPTEINLAEAIVLAGVNALKYYHSSSSTNVTINTTTFTSDSLSFTPEAGTYLAIYSAETSHAVSGVDNRGEVAIQVAGSTVANSTREFGMTMAGISLASSAARATPVSVCVLTVNGSQLVRSVVREVTGSNITVGSRSLTLIRIGV